jgi:CRP-like cAMP-binding protein
MRIIEIKSAWQGNSDCNACSIRSSALFAELNEEDFAKIHSPIDDLRYEANAGIYTQGDLAEHLFTLREGYIKLLHINSDGSTRIVRLVMPGDLFGMEALLGKSYAHSATALSNIHLCRIPKAIISSLGEESVKKWGEALAQSESWFSEINTGRIEIRLARFFLRIAKVSGDMAVAPLFKREDMGLMMDVKFETISRALASMAEQGLISNISRLSIQIPSMKNLESFSQAGS